ncbi:transcriptional regulator [Pararhodobacter aggregans]|uniref:Transcriptional regulator n=2 Tax=Pararhodobacter aggregans TaxID=404875 RepID=A0A2T7UUW4_9RHOB|nr:BadM/Rrf2 family transcriptional regulator [Pararhodobacter aggregans]PVE48462.1 transcriptional regulator [Pararhodobacter aggregans]
MRKMSDGVEAALHSALVLTAVPDGKVLTGRSLATLHGVSESYLLKHLRALAAAGVIEAVPGPRGGYRLAREPGQITLLDIVEAIDGTEPAFHCREIRRRGPGKARDPCVYTSDCFIKTRMLAAEQAWRAALRAQSLADLVADGERLIDPGNKAAVAGFIADEQR